MRCEHTILQQQDVQRKLYDLYDMSAMNKLLALLDRLNEMMRFHRKNFRKQDKKDDEGVDQKEILEKGLSNALMMLKSLKEKTV